MRDSEFRVQVDLESDEGGLSLGDRLRSHDLDDDARKRLGGSVIVTRDGARMFIYAGTAEGAAEAESVVRELADAEGLGAEITVTRWHPIAAAWKDASEPLPESEEQRAAELREAPAELDQDAQHPAFVAIASFEPRFMRDLGI